MLWFFAFRRLVAVNITTRKSTVEYVADIKNEALDSLSIASSAGLHPLSLKFLRSLVIIPILNKAIKRRQLIARWAATRARNLRLFPTATCSR